MSTIRTFYKADSQKAEVRIVTGELYPGRDSEGDSVYENTHLKTFEAAASRVRACVEASVSMSARDVIEAERMLQQRRTEAADAVKLMAKVLDMKAPTASPETVVVHEYVVVDGVKQSAAHWPATAGRTIHP